nr:hypothetical protein [Tanacetum cinerariifolium]
HYTRRARIAQSSALPPIAAEPASPIGDDNQGEACTTNSGLEADQDRANIHKTSTLPSDSTPRVASLAADEGTQELEINSLEARIKLLEDKDRGVAAQSEDDAPIKGRRLDEEDEAAERVSDDTEEMATVLTSMDATSILTSGGVQVVPTAAEVVTATISIPTGSGVVSTASPTIPTASPIFTTAIKSTPHIRRKGKETMVESETPKKKKIARDAEIARIHAEEELQMLIDGLDRNNETVAKYLQEYYQFAVELPIERRIELISDLVKYQDHYEKILKYQTQQRKPLLKKQQKEFYMSVLKSHAAVPVEEVYVEALQVKHPIIDWKVHTEGHRSYWKIIWLGGNSANYQFFVDMLKHFDREDLNQLWGLVKEILSIRPTTSDKEKELWVELKRLFEPNVEDYLWTHTQNLMHAPVEWKLYNTCEVHHVSQMANDLILKIYKISNYPRQQDD